MLLNETAPLERYGHHLTTLATLGTFAPFSGYEAVVSRVMEVLQRKNRHVPLILAADEATRWAIVAEVIRRMATGDVPEPLRTQQVIGLDYEALFANVSDDQLIRQELRKQRYAPLHEKLAQTEPDSEEEQTALWKLLRWPALEEWIAPNMVLERLQAIFIAMRQAESSIVLYVDHFHRLIGGECDRYPIDAANLLKPALHRDRIRLIGTCMLEDYRQYIERDAAIERCCQPICVPETSEHGSAS